jgi:hypothetical protein
MFPSIPRKISDDAEQIFNEAVSKFRIHFFESQAKLCSVCIKKTQRDSISVSEVTLELDIL